MYIENYKRYEKKLINELNILEYEGIYLILHEKSQSYLDFISSQLYHEFE